MDYFTAQQNVLLLSALPLSLGPASPVLALPVASTHNLAGMHGAILLLSLVSEILLW